MIIINSYLFEFIIVKIGRSLFQHCKFIYFAAFSVLASSMAMVI